MLKHPAEFSSSRALARFALRHKMVKHLLVVAAFAFACIVSLISQSLAQSIAPIPAAEPSAVPIYPGDSIRAIVDGQPKGTTFLLKEGVHRMQQVIPKDGDSFIGEAGAIMNGSRRLNDFTRSGNYWITKGQFQQGQIHGTCMSINGVPYEGCRFAEDLFFDDVPLWQVTSRTEVRPGTWFFDYPNGAIYIADDPAGHTVELSTTKYAFHGSAENVTIRGLTIEKYAVPAQHGAIHAASPDDTILGCGWLVERNEIRLNHGVGVLTGNAMRVLSNNIHTNGQLGIGGTGDHVLVEGNIIAHNNYAGFSTKWEAGGAKFVKTTDLVVRRNYVADNKGSGLWTDTDNVNTTYEQNRVFRNTNAGIHHEVSYDAVIRNNEVVCNGAAYDVWLWGAQILIQNSQHVEVDSNTVVVCKDAGNGIAMIQQNRGSGLRGPRLTIGNTVHNNRITYLGNVGRSGAVADYNAERMYRGNNHFDYNHYNLPNPNAVRWVWRGVKTWTGFRAEGLESNGRLESR